MKKNNHSKENFNIGETGDLSGIGTIPNPIPSWMESFFKTYHLFPVEINDNLIEGYPIDDDF